MKERIAEQRNPEHRDHYKDDAEWHAMAVIISGCPFIEEMHREIPSIDMHTLFAVHFGRCGPSFVLTIPFHFVELLLLFWI